MAISILTCLNQLTFKNSLKKPISTIHKQIQLQPHITVAFQSILYHIKTYPLPIAKSSTKPFKNMSALSTGFKTKLDPTSLPLPIFFCNPTASAAALLATLMLQNTCHQIPQRNRILRHHLLYVAKHACKNIESFVQFPLEPSKLTGLTNANWGPQDQSVPKPDDTPVHLDLFNTCSLAGYIIWFGAPLDWSSSKCQTYTARSSTEAKISDVDECTKTLQQLRNILSDLDFFQTFQQGPISSYLQ